MDFIWRYFGFGAMYRWQNIIPITKEYDKYSFQKVDVYLKERIGKNMSIKKITLFFILCFFSLNAFSQTKEEYLKELQKAEQFEYGIVGFTAHESPLYETAEKFVNLCSDEELIVYLNDENPVVRCYVAYFLRDKKIKADWYKILLKELTDYQQINIMDCDLIFIYTAGDFFFENLFSKLTDSEQTKLKLKAIQQQSKLYFAESILLSDEKSADLYSATRKWALKEKDTAIYALAKYNKPEDLELISRLKELNPDLFFKACKFNMNDSYKPFLKKYMISIMLKDHFYNEWKSFYKLIADYHDDFSKEIFDMAFSDKVNKTIQKYHLEFIFCAIADSRDGFYDEYLKKLWLQYYFVDEKIVSYFLQKDKTLTIEEMKTTLLNSEKYWNKKDTLDFIIKTLYENKIDLSDYFSNGIKNDSVHTIEVYMNNIDCVEKGDEKIVAAMEKRLNKETNPYIAIPIYKYLVSLNDKSINDYLIKTYNKNKNKYPNWALDEFNYLINSIK